MKIEDVALKEEIGVKAIEGIIDRHLKRQVNWKEIKRARVLGLDEIALQKGHDVWLTSRKTRKPRWAARSSSTLCRMRSSSATLSR